MKRTLALLAALWCCSPAAFGATVNLCGWEAGDISETPLAFGTVSVQSTVKRTGSYALRTNPTTTNTGGHQFDGFSAAGVKANFSIATIYVRFYFRYATKPSSGSEQIFKSGGGHIHLRIDSNGNLMAFDQTGTAQLGSTGTTALAADTWYRIEIKAGSTSSDVYEVRIDGSTELSGSGANLGSGNHTHIRVGKTDDRNGNTVDFFYDDLVISDSGFPGPGEIKVMVANANGSTMQWTAGTNASDFNEVDEVPQDLTTYIKSTGASGDVGLMDFQDTGTVGIAGTVNSVKGQIATLEDPAGTGSTQIRIRSGATNSDSSGNDASGWTQQFRMLDADPDDAAAWTTGDLDAVEVGPVGGNTQVLRCTIVYLHVDYAPARRIIFTD